MKSSLPQKKRRRVAVIILNWNAFRTTIRCIESVLKSNYDNLALNPALIIIDNNSADDSVAQLKLLVEQYNREANNKFTLHLLANAKNRGYAGGNNDGIRYALKQRADYVFILNNDALIQPNTLATLISEAEKDAHIGIVAPLIRERGLIVAGGAVQWLKKELSHIHITPDSSVIIPSYAVGAALLIKKEVFEKIGMFDDRYFLYFDDADFSLRAQEAGFRIRITPETKIFHEVSLSTKKLGAPLLLYYHVRNALYFNQKLGPWWIKLLVYPWGLVMAVKQVIKLIIGRERKLSWMILRGIGDFYRKQMGKIQYSF